MQLASQVLNQVHFRACRLKTTTPLCRHNLEFECTFSLHIRPFHGVGESVVAPSHDHRTSPHPNAGYCPRPFPKFIYYFRSAAAALSLGSQASNFQRLQFSYQQAEVHFMCITTPIHMP